MPVPMCAKNARIRVGVGVVSSASARSSMPLKYAITSSVIASASAYFEAK